MIDQTSTFSQKLFHYGIASLGLFPIIPNKQRPVLVILLLVLGFYSFFKFKSNCRKEKILYPVLFSLLPILYALSLYYTANIEIGLRRIQTAISLLIVPWAAYFIFSRITLSVKTIQLMCRVLFISSCLFGIIIISYYAYLGYFTEFKYYLYYSAYLDRALPGYKQHPIYASMIIACGLVAILGFVKKSNRTESVFVLIGALILLFVLFLLFRRGVFISLLVCAVFLTIHFSKRINKKILLVTTGIIMCFGLGFKDYLTSRLSELSFSLDGKEGICTSSFQARIAIYNCTIDLIAEKPLFGHGIGDGYQVIKECIEDGYNMILEKKKNSHNQYLGVLLYTGIIGFIIFIAQLANYLGRGIKRRNALLSVFIILFCCIMLFENILDRQTGVLLFALILNVLFYLNLKSDQLGSEKDNEMASMS